MGVCCYLINATRYGVDTTQRCIHIKMEEESTAADQKQKNPKRFKKQQIIIMLKIKKPSLAAASEQAKAPLQIH